MDNVHDCMGEGNGKADEIVRESGEGVLSVLCPRMNLD